MSKCRFAFTLVLLFYFAQAEGAIAGGTQYELKDSLGIVISAHQFDSLVGCLLIKFKSDTSQRKIDDYILLVKVCNTIIYDQLGDSSEECRELYSLYVYKYFKIAVEKTEAAIFDGYACYSKKYDLQFGGRKTKNNFFRIIH
jgi:hypothetical protein